MLLASGLVVAISRIRAGTKVRATDPYQHQTADRPVVKVIRHHRWHAMAAIVLVTGAVIQATSQHPIWDATTGQFTYAASLRPGDKLLEPDGATVAVEAVRHYQADLTAWNLDVSGIHTYYVQAGQVDVLVHNSCGLNDPNSEISQVSMAARMTHGVEPSQNVAVYRIGEGGESRFIAAANEPRGLHSEEILNNYINDPANGISREDVTAIYSERVPCETDPHNCSSSLLQYSNAQGNISWSLEAGEEGAAGKIANAMGEYAGTPPRLPMAEWIRP